MLAPGVSARDTAERETPASRATSLAVTRRPDLPAAWSAPLMAVQVWAQRTAEQMYQLPMASLPSGSAISSRVGSSRVMTGV